MMIVVREGVLVVVVGLVLCLGCASDDEGGPPPPPPGRETLAATGLYADLAGGVLADGVLEFRPEFELWSDGAEKRRFIALPAGESIDTTDMDGWVYPVGTRVWKEFTRDGVRVETRLLEKVGPDRWDAIAYIWNEDQTDAIGTTAGAENVLGTDHDVPDLEGCGGCHDGAPDQLLGFTAIQLDHDLGGTSVTTLTEAGLITDAPAASLDPPGDETAVAALGYLHANCGNCHRGEDWLPLDLRLQTGALATVEETPFYMSAVSVPSMVDMPLADTDATEIVVPGNADSSLLFIRMGRRGPPGGGMPAGGTELVDDAGLAAVRAFIESL